MKTKYFFRYLPAGKWQFKLTQIKVIDFKIRVHPTFFIQKPRLSLGIIHVFPNENLDFVIGTEPPAQNVMTGVFLICFSLFLFAVIFEPL